MMSLIRLFAVLFIMASSFAQAAPHDGGCLEKDTSFREFLAKFGDNKSFQMKRIIFPLIARFGYPIAESPTVELWGSGTVKDFKNPIILSRSDRQRKGIEQQVPIATETYAEAFHFKPEADSYRILYQFRKYDGCWYLEGLHDTAL